jgi:hypothetical protein
MASYVYFKFKSQKEPQRVTIDGPHTDVWNLKREIISISRLGDGTDFDLKIYKENSNEGKFDLFARWLNPLSLTFCRIHRRHRDNPQRLNRPRPKITCISTWQGPCCSLCIWKATCQCKAFGCGYREQIGQDSGHGQSDDGGGEIEGNASIHRCAMAAKARRNVTRDPGTHAGEAVQQESERAGRRATSWVHLLPLWQER